MPGILLGTTILDCKTEFDITLLYQLSYTPHIRDPKAPLVVTYATLPGDGRGDRTRTCDPRHLKLVKVAVTALLCSMDVWSGK